MRVDILRFLVRLQYFGFCTLGFSMIESTLEAIANGALHE